MHFTESHFTFNCSCKIIVFVGLGEVIILQNFSFQSEHASLCGWVA